MRDEVDDEEEGVSGQSSGVHLKGRGWILKVLCENL